MNKKVLIITSIVLLIDQVIKGIVDSYITLNESILIIKNFCYLTYVHNYGAAWSLFLNQTFLLIIATLVALFIIFRFMNTFKNNWRNNLAFGLLLGGISGNLIDRMFCGYVKDFLDFKIFGYDFPVFNISDIAIFFGVCLLIIAIFKGEDHENKSK